jgi:hypothetical protein
MKESMWIAPWWATIAAVGQCIAALVAAWAAIAAQRSATLAKRTVDIMERTSQNSDRAYISMDEILLDLKATIDHRCFSRRCEMQEKHLHIT